MSSLPDAAKDALQAKEAALALVAEHRRLIEAYAYAITRDAHLAEDVFQEVAVVVGRRGDAPPLPGFLPWLKEVVRRKALELGRQRRRGGGLSDEALAQVADALDDEPRDEVAAMAACLERLGGDARTAVLGRYRDELDVPAIAARLGRTVQGAYAVLKRARRMLGDCIEATLRRSAP